MIPYVKRNPMKEYKVVIYQESQLSSLFFGAAKVNPVNFSAFLNKQTPRRLAGRDLCNNIGY